MFYFLGTIFDLSFFKYLWSRVDNPCWDEPLLNIFSMRIIYIQKSFGPTFWNYQKHSYFSQEYYDAWNHLYKNYFTMKLQNKDKNI